MRLRHPLWSRSEARLHRALDASSRAKTAMDGVNNATKAYFLALFAVENEIPDLSATTARSVALPLWKRMLDISLVTLTAPLWLPLMMLILVWVKTVSPGPVFYWQARIGYRGQRFLMFKFRTMKIHADTSTHESYFERLMQNDCPMIKLDAGGDPRLLPGGGILRASGLDELPQIFNVIAGTMSLVGPRPCTPHEFERYQGGQRERVNAVPGLTGYWQVNGKNHTTFREMIAMDLFYIANRSLWLDLRIILKTFPALYKQVLERKKFLPIAAAAVPVIASATGEASTSKP